MCGTHMLGKAGHFFVSLNSEMSSTGYYNLLKSYQT